MAKKSVSEPLDLVYQIRTHLAYELQWLIYAASRFRIVQGDEQVPLQDSAAVHARNLLEWARTRDRTRFTLGALGGTTAKASSWEKWLNNRVTHMLQREHEEATWPGGPGTWSQPDRLMRMAKVVLDRMRNGLMNMPEGDARTQYEIVLEAAEDYWSEPTQENLETLSGLHDGSRDRPYPE